MVDLLLRLASPKTIVIEYGVTMCNYCLGEAVLFRLVARVPVPPIIMNSMSGQKHRFLASRRSLGRAKGPGDGVCCRRILGASNRVEYSSVKVFATILGDEIDGIEVILEFGDVEDEILGSDCDGDVVTDALCDRRVKSVNCRIGVVSGDRTCCANVSQDCENRHRQKRSHCE